MKLVPPKGTPEPRGIKPRGSALSKAQEAAIERSRSRYIELQCGHLTTYEVIYIYAVFGNVETFCEACGIWQRQKPKPKPTPVPIEPLF